PDPLLHLRLPVRDLRCGERVPVPLGHGIRASRVRGGGGDGYLHSHPRRGAPLRVAQGGAAVGVIDKVPVPKPMKFILNWGRRYSLWVMNFGLACCAIEFIAVSDPRHDFIRFGVVTFAYGPRSA